MTDCTDLHGFFLGTFSINFYTKFIHHSAGYSVNSRQDIKTTYNEQFTSHYKGRKVGDYIADMIVENTVLLELKASSILVNDNVLQLTNYLRATPVEVGILLNFGTKPEIKRVIFTNDRKKLAR
jgi:GxxExxY protein